MMTRWFNSLPYVSPIVNEFIITVKTDNAGTSNSDQFTIPTSVGGNTIGYNYDIVTSDGYTATGITGNHTITFPSGAGVHTVTISGSFPKIHFNGLGDRLKFLELKNFGIYGLGATIHENTFRGCSNLTITAKDIGHFENAINFARAWEGCSSLTSFPLIDTGKSTNISSTWAGCSSLTSFPLIDTSNVTTLQDTWVNCTSLTSFPLLNTAKVTNFLRTWLGCSSLTIFPLIDTSSGSSFNQSWRNCTSLTSFPANAFNNIKGGNFTLGFLSTALTTQSIDNVLVSLNTSGVSNGAFNQSGGQAPSVSTGRPAIDSLRAKGWTIAVTGGY